jgi:signal transduction histidine kinase
MRHGRVGESAATWRSLHYALALCSVGLAAALTWAFPQVLAGTPFLAFYPAVVVAAMFGGFGPGVVATLSSSLCYALWFDPTPFDLSRNPADWLRIAIFCGGGTGVSLLARLQQKSRVRERRQAQEILEINQTLEYRIAERAAESERRAEELRALAGELSRTEERAQRRVAQWLHDELQQLLVATKMQVELTSSAIQEPGLRELLAKACRLIDESIGQSRSLTAELMPPVLYKSGLVPGLEQLARWVEEKHRLRVTVEATTDVTPENQEAAVVLFNATRELLFNVVKHAGVTEAQITLREKDGRVQLTVEDQGAGFDAVLVQDGAHYGFGLLNVRERLHSIGGDFQLRSTPGNGTCVTLFAPAAPGRFLKGS